MVITLYFCTIQRHPQRPSLSSPLSAHAWDHHPFQKLTCPQLPTACQGCWPGCCSATVLHLPTHPSTPGLWDAQPLLASGEGWSNKIPDSKFSSLGQLQSPGVQAGPSSAESPTKGCGSGAQNYLVGSEVGGRRRLSLTLLLRVLFGGKGTVLGSWFNSGNGNPGIPILLSGIKVPSKRCGCILPFSQLALCVQHQSLKPLLLIKYTCASQPPSPFKSGRETGAGDLQTWRHMCSFRETQVGWLLDFCFDQEDLRSQAK